MDFNITIEDEAHLYAIRQAMGERTEEEYIQFVVENACDSWAKQYPMPDKQAYAMAIGELDNAKLTATKDQLAKIELAQSLLIDIKLGK